MPRGVHDVRGTSIQDAQTWQKHPEGSTDPPPLKRIGMPTWLGGAARGLLGRKSDVQFRHKRGASLKQSDLVIVCGFPFDFRLKYGRGFGKATLVSANLSAEEIKKNRKPDIGVQMHPADFLRGLASAVGQSGQGRWDRWFSSIREREDRRYLIARHGLMWWQCSNDINHMVRKANFLTRLAQCSGYW